MLAAAPSRICRFGAVERSFSLATNSDYWRSQAPRWGAAGKVDRPPPAVSVRLGGDRSAFRLPQQEFVDPGDRMVGDLGEFDQCFQEGWCGAPVCLFEKLGKGKF